MRRLILFCLISVFIFSAVSSVNAAELEQADGTVLSGRLLQIDQNQFSFQTATGTSVFPAAEIMRVDLAKTKRADQVSGLVVLANDDRIYANIIRSNDEAIVVQPNACPDSGEWKIPLETVQAVFLQWPTAPLTQSQLLQRIARLKQNSDLFYLKNGDYLEGEFVGFDDQQFRFESNAGETAVPRAGMAFFRFNPELINFPQPDQLRYRIELVDGSRVVVTTLELIEKQLTAQTLFGANIQCKQDHLASITPLGGRVIPLSSLEPSRYEFTPYFTQKWDWYRNRNAAAGPLRVAGTEYVTGLGVHSSSELHYELNGKYTGFQTLVGIDDSTNGEGAVEVSILVDQRTVFQESISAAGQKAAISIPRINLDGARELVLKVDFGKNADIQDLVDWCQPVLIQKK